MPPLPPVVIIAGPTASGKSALALETAQRFDGEIINADSMQVYRELSVLTARPTARDEAKVPHHLYGTLSAREACSAGKWLDMAVAAINDCHRRGKLAVVCGGTGLYVKVLKEGLAAVPDVPPELVRQSESLFRSLGGDAFRQCLAEIDPIGAARLQPSDRQRLVRAHAVATATGTSLTDWHKAQSQSAPVNARFFTLHLLPERAALYQKIAHRLEIMLETGGMEEVRALAEQAYDPSLPAMKALAVPELLAVLRGDMDRETALQQAQKTTRNLAKRQFTWFRNQGEPDLVLAHFGFEALEAGLAAISEFLNPS